jgi:hypothetical protein
MYDPLLQIIPPIKHAVNVNESEPVIEDIVLDEKPSAEEKPMSAEHVKPVSKGPPKECAPAQRRDRITDSLFWSIYSSTLTPMERMQISDSRIENQLIAEKQKIVESFHSKDALKTLKNIDMKITNNQTQEILSEIMTSKTSTLLSVVAYAIYYKLRIYIVNPVKQNYLSYVPHAYTNTIVVHAVNPRFHRYELSTTGGAIDPTYMKMEGFETPLKSVSNYKIADLEQIGERCGIPRNGAKKPDYYAAIVQHYLW